MEESFLKLENISKSFGQIQAVKNLSLSLKKSELFTLLGSSGCGKSTLLRIIAGFEKPDEGKVILDGKDITHLPAYDRPLNFMFQSYALFPHLNVYENIKFGLKNESLLKDEIEKRISDVLQLLKLNDQKTKKIDQLSGGQQQRVALARCLAKKPKLLLLDEPLAALDKKLREHTQFELTNLQDQLGITFVVVTHDQEEAMSISDRIAVMKDGEISQIGSPIEIYEKPINKFVGDFVGTANFFELSKKENIFFCPNSRIEFKNNLSQSRFCLIRPEKIRLRKTTSSDNNNINTIGTIREKAYLGSYTKYIISVEEKKIYTVMQNTNISDGNNFDWNDTVVLDWDLNSIIYFNE